MVTRLNAFHAEAASAHTGQVFKQPALDLGQCPVLVREAKEKKFLERLDGFYKVQNECLVCHAGVLFTLRTSNFFGWCSSVAGSGVNLRQAQVVASVLSAATTPAWLL